MARLLWWLVLPFVLAGAKDSIIACDGNKPATFLLAGDSTTAVQSAGGGGWGNGFLSFLKSPARGTNFGHNGATTVSFVKGGDWARVMEEVKGSRETSGVYVTIQVSYLRI